MNGRNRHDNSHALELQDVLAIIFIVLKLVGVIDWSWWWVLSPWWISIALILFAIVLT